MSLQSKPWIIALLCCIVLIAGIITILVHKMSGASVGTVQVDQQQSGQSVSATHSQPVSIDTSYFTAILPSDFTIKHQAETPNTPFLLQLEANTPATEDEQLGVTIGHIPTDGLRGVGDYNLRITESNTYHQTTLSNLPAGAVAFQNADAPAALTVFWPHGTLYTELAFSTSGGATYSQLETLYSQLSANWKWK